MGRPVVPVRILEPPHLRLVNDGQCLKGKEGNIIVCVIYGPFVPSMVHLCRLWPFASSLSVLLHGRCFRH